MPEFERTEPLLEIVFAGSVDIPAAWQRWRAMRPDLDEVTDAEVVVLPAAWGRARQVGVTDADAARLDGLRRKAALTTSVTLGRVVTAQAALRQAGVESAVSGGASVVLLGAVGQQERNVRGAELWVGQADLAAAATALGGRLAPGVGPTRWRGYAGVALPTFPGLVLRSRLPSLPPVDGRLLVAARTAVQWTHSRVELLGPAETILVADCLYAVRRVVAQADRFVGSGGRQITAAALVGWELDRRLLQRLPAFDPVRLRRLRRLTGLRATRPASIHG